MNVSSRYLLSTLLLVLAGTASAEIETVTWLHTDHLGSPLMARDAQGNTLWQEDYSPWGERLAAPTANSADIGYTGHYEEADIGLTYAQARWYDPAVGRFLSADAVGFAGGGVAHFGRYDYAYFDPFGYTDPDGREGVRIGAEASLPGYVDILEIAAHAVGILEPGESVPIDGVAVGLVLTFPGPAGGEWGVGVSADAVMGIEVVADTAKRKQILDADSWKRVGRTYEFDFNWAAKVPSDMTSKPGPMERGAMVGRFGGQVSSDEENGVVGVGVKLGSGIGPSINQNHPLIHLETE